MPKNFVGRKKNDPYFWALELSKVYFFTIKNTIYQKLRLIIYEFKSK